MVRRIGAIRNTARKNVPGNRYLKGMKRLVEYRMKIPTAASSSTASHIQDCWETSTGARKTVTARVVPSTSTRAITAGTVTDRVGCAGEWYEMMGLLCVSGRGGTEGRRAAAAGESVRAAGEGPGRTHRAGSADQPIWEEISSPAEVIVEWGSAPPTMLACAMPSGP